MSQMLAQRSFCTRASGHFRPTSRAIRLNVVSRGYRDDDDFDPRDPYRRRPPQPPPGPYSRRRVEDLPQVDVKMEDIFTPKTVARLALPLAAGLGIAALAGPFIAAAVATGVAISFMLSIGAFIGSFFLIPAFLFGIGFLSFFLVPISSAVWFTSGFFLQAGVPLLLRLIFWYHIKLFALLGIGSILSLAAGLTLMVGLGALGVATLSGGNTLSDIFSGMFSPPGSRSGAGSGGSNGPNFWASSREASPQQRSSRERDREPPPKKAQWVDEVEEQRREAEAKLREFDELLDRRDKFKKGM